MTVRTVRVRFMNGPRMGQYGTVPQDSWGWSAPVPELIPVPVLDSPPPSWDDDPATLNPVITCRQVIYRPMYRYGWSRGGRHRVPVSDGDGAYLVRIEGDP